MIRLRAPVQQWVRAIRTFGRHLSPITSSSVPFATEPLNFYPRIDVTTLPDIELPNLLNCMRLQPAAIWQALIGGLWRPPQHTQVVMNQESAAWPRWIPVARRRWRRVLSMKIVIDIDDVTSFNERALAWTAYQVAYGLSRLIDDEQQLAAAVAQPCSTVPYSFCTPVDTFVEQRAYMLGLQAWVLAAGTTVKVEDDIQRMQVLLCDLG